MRYLFLLSLLFSCTTTHQKLELNTPYRMDMVLNTDGKKYTGTGVLPKQYAYNLHIVSPGKADLLSFNTCARDINVEQSSMKLINNKETTIQFVPTELERNKPEGCLAYAAAYEKKFGRHSWGLFDFKMGHAELPARITCNGEVYTSDGVTVCQSKIGLWQKIEFKTPVKVNESSSCRIEEKTDTSFTFQIKEGHCSYIFYSEDFKLHRMTTYGYLKVILREG